MVFVESAGIPLVQVCAYDSEDNPIWSFEKSQCKRNHGKWNFKGPIFILGGDD